MFNLYSQADTPKLFPWRYCLLLWLSLTIYNANAQTYYTADQLPNPQVNGRTNLCNPDGILRDAETDSLNNLAAAMKQSTGTELAIVVVHNFDIHENDFNFATTIFRKWGVGGAHSNSGLLLLITVDRKQYRFITGYGLEGLLPDAALLRVGKHYLVPAFKKGEYGHGIINAVTVINDYLRQPANQRDIDALMAQDRVSAGTSWYQPVGAMVLIILISVFLFRHIKKKVPALPGKRKSFKGAGYDDRIARIIAGVFFFCFASVFVLAFTIGFSWIKHITLTGAAYILYALLAIGLALKYLNALSIIRKTYTDDMNYNKAAYNFQLSVWWYIFFSPLVLLLIISEAAKRTAARKRLLPQTDKDGSPLTRIDRDENPTGNPYLTQGQKREEENGVYSYDIWAGATADNFKVIGYKGRNYGKYDACPKCGFKTLARPVVDTVIAPTYTAKGQGKKAAHCSFCQYEQLIKMVTLPMLAQNSSSSSSSDSGSSSSSSSSSSGSFGGGSTGGGGAGGSW